MQRIGLVLALGLLAGAGAAGAAEEDFSGRVYVGAGLSNDKIEGITHTGVPFSDINKTSWKVLAGFRPVKILGFEADYLDLGNKTSTLISGASTHSDAKAFAGYAVGFLPLPLPLVDVFGKAGVARWKLNGSSSTGALPLPPGNFFAFSDQGTEFAWGAGVQAHLGNIGGRLEYERFRIPNTDDARVFSLSFILSLF